MSDKFFDLVYGDLNPSFVSDVEKRYPSETGLNPEVLLRPAFESLFKGDALKNTGQIKAIVLRVEKASSIPGDWLKDLSGIEDDFVRIRARIPEIHPIPVPEDANDHAIINLYPVFKSKNKGMKIPAVGSIVWVDFGNRSSQEDPIYLGPVVDWKTSVNSFGAKKNKTVIEQDERKRGTLKAAAPTGDPIGRVERVKKIIPGKPQKVSFSKRLDDIDFNLVPDELITKWEPRLRAGTLSGRRSKLFPILKGDQKENNNKNQKWTIILMGCLESMEQYWKQSYSNARIGVSSHFRSLETKNHNGGAADYFGSTGSRRLTALELWAGTQKLIEAGKIPAGGHGIYLNVTDEGVRGLEPEQAGKSVSKVPGGSAGPHFDFRGHYDYQKNRRGRKWISLNLTKNDNKDDIPGAYVGSEIPKALDYLRGKEVRIAEKDSKVDKKKGVNISKSIAGELVQLPEDVDLSGVADFYEGEWKNYSFAPNVGNDVQNLLEILGQLNKMNSINETIDTDIVNDSDNQLPRRKE